MPRAVVITVSDSRSAGRAVDESGPVAAEMLQAMGLEVSDRIIVPDVEGRITSVVKQHVGKVAVVVCTGGTGVGPRDVTPEAVYVLFDKELPGFGEIMRTGSYAKTPLSIISRGGAGIAEDTLIIAIPGSPKAVRESLELLAPAIKHLLKILANPKTDCVNEAAGSPQSSKDDG